MNGEGLTGDYRVRLLGLGFNEIRKLCHGKVRDGMKIRRHLLKLRYWPQARPEDDGGQVLDIDWCWIKSLPSLDIGELRIHDTIAGNDNLRGIFFVGDPAVVEPLPMIWILAVMQKKRDDFTTHQLAVFRARRLLVKERFYDRDVM